MIASLDIITYQIYLAESFPVECTRYIDRITKHISVQLEVLQGCVVLLHSPRTRLCHLCVVEELVMLGPITVEPSGDAVSYHTK
jgi:hypothetical protein